MDETGNIYGSLVVMRQTEGRRAGNWDCLCACGNTISVPAGVLHAGDKKSCGCLRRYKNEIGNRYGKLKVLSLDRFNQLGLACWKCICDCGNTISITGANLRSGNSKTCGCNTLTHGLNHHPIYQTFQRAKTRCTNPKYDGWNRYGGRGIEFRLGTFEEFAKRMLPSWVEGLTLDRRDNNGHYEYDNIRWATPLEQAANRCSNVVLTYDNQTMHISAWARKLGVSKACIRARYLRFDGDVEKTLNITPKGK